MNKSTDWVLNGPYSDKSLIRNILAYRLSRELGHYAPRTKLCELILNGEYRGVYVLIEKIKRDKYGQATTHWDKLIEGINRGLGNPCPSILIGIEKERLIDKMES